MDEIGTVFQTGAARFDWKQWRTTVGDDLAGGYATVVYTTQIEHHIDRINKEWQHASHEVE